MLLILAGAAGLTAVAMGAFGAHALRDAIDTNAFANYQTGALYHLVHAAALFGAALLARDVETGRMAGWAAAFFATGIVFFSGSLYILAITGQKWLGAVTPIGGIAFMVGWALIAVAGWRASA